MTVAVLLLLLHDSCSCFFFVPIHLILLYDAFTDLHLLIYRSRSHDQKADLYIPSPDQEVTIRATTSDLYEEPDLPPLEQEATFSDTDSDLYGAELYFPSPDDETTMRATIRASISDTDSNVCEEPNNPSNVICQYLSLVCQLPYAIRSTPAPNSLFLSFTFVRYTFSTLSYPSACRITILLDKDIQTKSANTNPPGISAYIGSEC